MHIDSLGLQTQLFILGHHSEIQDHGNFLAIITKDSPNFWWGNFLCYDSPASLETLSQWETQFEKIFSNAKHKAFTWNGEIDTPTKQALTQKGYECHAHNVLVLKTKNIRNIPSNFIIRKLQTDDDWKGVKQIYLDSRDPSKMQNPQRDIFLTKFLLNFRKLTEQNKASWYGAFVDDHLAGSLGICFCEKSARFQEVIVAPNFRRQGIAKYLVTTAMQLACTQNNFDNFVIVAEQNSIAEALYKKLGFTLTHHDQGMILK